MWGAVNFYSTSIYSVTREHPGVQEFCTQAKRRCCFIRMYASAAVGLVTSGHGQGVPDMHPDSSPQDLLSPRIDRMARNEICCDRFPLLQ